MRYLILSKKIYDLKQILSIQHYETPCISCIIFLYHEAIVKCFVFTGRLIHLESVLCSEGDEDCLSLVCPQHMRFNREKDGCENKEEVLELAQMGVVGNNKLMCREGFVWVEWKSQCLRKT